MSTKELMKMIGASAQVQPVQAEPNVEPAVDSAPKSRGDVLSTVSRKLTSERVERRVAVPAHLELAVVERIDKLRPKGTSRSRFIEEILKEVLMK